MIAAASTPTLTTDARPPAPAVVEQEGDSGTGDASLDEVAASQRLRASLHLDASRDTVVALSAEPGAGERLERWGAYVSETEAVELAVRERLEVVDGPLADWATHQPGFAGFHVDHATGQLVLAMTGADPAAEEQLAAQATRAQLPLERYRVDVVAHSLAELRAVVDGLVERRHELALDGLVVQGAGISVRDNGVVVVVDAAATTSPASPAHR